MSDFVNYLAADDWLSAREARSLFFYFVRWADHLRHELRSLPDVEVEKRLQAAGYDLPGMIAALQKNPHAVLHEFEPLAESGNLHVEVFGTAKAQISLTIDGVVISNTQVADPTEVRLEYLANFNEACHARNAAIEKSNFGHFYTALQKGFAAIEAYVSLRALVYNAKCDPSARLEERRPKGGFVNLDEKISDWIPKMTGMTIERDSKRSPAWADFKYLQNLRNDVATHPKQGAGLKTLPELADGLNRFRTGVGSLMFALHRSFREPIPSPVIRAMLYPTIRVAKRKTK